MKKLLITLICFCLILCPVLNSGAAFAEEPDPSAELSSEPSPEPPAEPEPPSQPAEEPAQEPAPSYAPVVITKSPGGETKNEGDTAYFIAHADNAVAIEWLLVSPDGSNMISAKDGPVHFPGLSVDGLYDDTLILANLPVSLNGWRIQARYTGGDGNTVLTDWCSIYVNGVVVPQPIIGLQPTGGNFQVNEDCTLRCNAYSTDNLRVTLQWYSAAESSTASGSPIFGANADSYTVPHTA
ncbi:MAG: hypothetical protein MJ135_08180, partial [Oscillospiraceae bacterium]|nr:hypothetical protein [Oscillospiraceae bacterium]